MSDNHFLLMLESLIKGDLETFEEILSEFVINRNVMEILEIGIAFQGKDLLVRRSNSSIAF